MPEVGLKLWHASDYALFALLEYSIAEIEVRRHDPGHPQHQTYLILLRIFFAVSQEAVSQSGVTPAEEKTWVVHDREHEISPDMLHCLLPLIVMCKFAGLARL